MSGWTGRPAAENAELGRGGQMLPWPTSPEVEGDYANACKRSSLRSRRHADGVARGPCGRRSSSRSTLAGTGGGAYLFRRQYLHRYAESASCAPPDTSSRHRSSAPFLSGRRLRASCLAASFIRSRRDPLLRAEAGFGYAINRKSSCGPLKYVKSASAARSCSSRQRARKYVPPPIRALFDTRR